MTEHTDKELIRLFRFNRNKGFNLIVRKYQERLYWHVRKIVISHADADDVIQNTFIKAFHGLDHFREDASLYTWLYRIATNESLTFLNKHKNWHLLPMRDYQEYLERNLESDPYTEGNEIQMKLQKALIHLPRKQRLVFNMKYFEGLKYDEISEILETSVGALKASYHHAVKKIKQYLSEN